MWQWKQNQNFCENILAIKYCILSFQLSISVYNMYASSFIVAVDLHLVFYC